MKYFGTLFFFLFFVKVVCAQKSFEFGQAPKMTLEGQLLDFPFAGGINAAQLQSMDVTGNGKEELVIWDRNSRRLLVFAENENELVHKPALTHTFPNDISGYLILADFNGNGRKDLFTSSPFGIKAYRNSGQSTTGPQWEVAQNFLRLEGGSNLQANNLDTPIIMDIDGDGDLDVVTFNFAAGDYLEYYKNTSIERKGTADIDGFASAKIRWGNFEFCGCGQFAFGITCAGFPIQQSDENDGETLRIQHTGGHSMLLYDFTGNGLLDLVMGQDECNTLYFLANTGTNESPLFTEFSTELPGLGTLPTFPIFHLASLYKEDLIISTIAQNRSQEHNIDYSKSMLRFPRENNGWQSSPVEFLQDQMIDLGENARPLFKGNSSLGELLVSSNQVVGDQVVGSVTRFTLDQDGFQQREKDHLNFSSLGLTDLQMQQISNHQFFSGARIVNFTQVRSLYYAKGGFNIEQAQEIFIPEVALRGNDHLEFFNHDNQDYLLLARQTGELIKYKVSFGIEPAFTLMERNYLGFSDNPASRNLTVHVVKETNRNPDLYASDQRGNLFLIEDFMNQSQRQEELLVIENNRVNTRFGRNTWISSVPQVFDGIADLVLGTASGGLIYLSQTMSGPGGIEEKLQVKFYPNPTEDFLTVISSENATAQLISSLGQILLESVPLKSNVATQLDLIPYSPGVYYLRVEDEKGFKVGKKIIKK